MPAGEPHRRQQRKNYVLLAVLLALMALLYAIAMMKMGAGNS